MPALAAYLSISNCCVFSSLQLTYTSVIAVQGCNASVFLQAAKDLHKLGPKYVLIKGGHLIAAPSDPTRSSSDSQPSPSSARSQTPSAGSVAQDSESAPASSAAQDSESASASSAAQDSESASARDCNIAQDATHDSNQSVSELSADSSLGEGHLQGQALSQHTDGGGAEQDTDLHDGELSLSNQSVHLCWRMLTLHSLAPQVPHVGAAMLGRQPCFNKHSLAGSAALNC